MVLYCRSVATKNPTLGPEFKREAVRYIQAIFPGLVYPESRSEYNNSALCGSLFRVSKCFLTCPFNKLMILHLQWDFLRVPYQINDLEMFVLLSIRLIVLLL